MSTRSWWWRRSDADFSAEIETHLAHEADELTAAGADPADARLAARRRFGNVTAAEERFYESRRWMWIDRARQDVRDAIRSIVRYPIASTVAILSMAAGIGVATVTLTIRNIVFHNPPLHYANPRELSMVQIGRNAAAIMPIGSYPPGEIVAAWSDALGRTSVAAALPPQGIRDVRTGDRTEAVPVRSVSPEFFDVLGVKTIAGRTFADDAAGRAAPPAMLSHRLWKQWFDAAPDAVGRTIWIENRPHTIVGVLPAGFWFSDMNSPVWTRLDRDAIRAQDALEVVVRRPPGVTPAGLAGQLDTAVRVYAARQPADHRTLRLKVSPIEGTPMGKQMSILLPWVLGVAALLTLLIACANVAILTIAQWTTREHEISIRASIGASRGRLIRSLLTESLVVALCGGALGVAATFALRALMLQRDGIDDESFTNVSVPVSVFAQCAAATIIAGILTGLAPAIFETRRLHGHPMRVSTMTDHLRQRWRHALVVLEIGVTVALLVVASAFINGYRRSLTADLGFVTNPLMSARVQNSKGVPVDIVIGALNATPGVRSVAASTTIPFTVRGPRVRTAADADGANASAVERGEITPEFFSTLGVAVQAGRAFTNQDAGNARVAIVNVALAQRLFGSADAVGRRVYVDGAPFDIVGVAANFENQVFFRDHDPRIFMPLATTPAPARAAFVVRAGENPAPLVQTVRRAIRDAAPGNVVTSAFTFDAIKTVTGQEVLVGTAPLAPLILIGLLLTTAGIYGVLAFAVARRSRELAVRIAIGATGRDLTRLVSRHTTRLVGTGAFLGGGLTYALTRIVRALGGAGSVFDADWTAFAAPVVIIAVVAGVATWVPARRVRRIDPAQLLRST